MSKRLPVSFTDSKYRRKNCRLDPRRIKVYIMRTTVKDWRNACALLVCSVLLYFMYSELTPQIPKSIATPTLQCARAQVSSDSIGPPVFIAVVSNCKNFRAREAIRKTWGSVATSFSSKVVFFVGKDAGCTETVRREMKRFQDVVVLDQVQETYDNLPLKTMHMLQYVAQHHGDEFHYIAKCDDDVFVHVSSLSKLMTLNLGLDKPAEYMGFFHNNSVPIKKRGCKWFDEHYSMDIYPPYAGGMFYILSNRIVRYVAKNAGDFALWANEDSTVGTWVQGLDPKIAHFDQVWPSRVYAKGQKEPPVAIHLEWATGQGVTKGWVDDKPIATLIYQMQKHLDTFHVPLGRCEGQHASMDRQSYMKAFGQLYTAPTVFSESRMGALQCSGNF
mgnify:CR=1 FL=1|jgi:hypothetical protein